jgi:radical SAM superfamily enzyme YgiQ (UPF0313 family)
MKRDLISAVYNIVVIIMLDYVLVNPPSPFLIDQTVMPPLGIMYLSSYLKSKGYSVEIFDIPSKSNVESIPEARVTAFTSTTPQYPEAIKCLGLVKNNNTIKVIGGPHATCNDGKCLNDGFDVVCTGEGELSLELIINSSDISNALLGGSIIEDINTLPFPDREWDGFDKYNYYIDNTRATTMVTSRGCPFHCYFCCNIYDMKMRLRSAENVIEEARILSEKYGFKAIQLYDDTFTVNKKRAISISKGFKQLGIKWRCFIHANTVDKQLLQIMHDSGCIEVGIGVESGSQKILNIVNKKTTTENVIKVHDMCHDIGLRIKAFLMIGLPGENYTTVDSTVDFLYKAIPDDFDITIYTPFPRTYIWDNVDKFDIKFDKESINYSNMFYKGRAGEYLCQVSTHDMPSADIEKNRDYIDINIRKDLYGNRSMQ